MTLTELRVLIRDAARVAFRDLLAAHPDEPFYAFALQTTGDATGVYAAANTEGCFDRCVARVSGNPGFPAEHYCRWYWGEWTFKSARRDLFAEVYRLLNLRDRGFDGTPAVKRFHVGAFAAMALALRDLDREKLYGTGPARERVVLMCTVDDSVCTDWVEEESALWLNPPVACQRFFASRRPRPEAPPDSERMRRAFVKLLDSQ